MKVNEYRTLIFDFDGVIVDSNNFKKQSIYKASLLFCNEELANDFTIFFTSNNGVPREKKIFDYFKNTNFAESLLNTYNQLLEDGLKDEIDVTEGFEDFITSNTQAINYIVSGGTESEVIEVVKHKKLDSFFKEIKGGPSSKYDNIKDLAISEPCLYIGDSKIDYEVANHFGFDFIFMNQYTQFEGWESFFADKKEVKIIKNFKDIIE